MVLGWFGFRNFFMARHVPPKIVLNYSRQCHFRNAQRFIISELEKLPGKIDIAKVFHVELVKPSPEAALGSDVIAELVKAVEKLCLLGQTEEPEELNPLAPV
jgi:hypothetical protein